MVCNNTIQTCDVADILLSSLTFRMYGLLFMPGECLADVVFVILCSEFVCGLVLSLLDDWLILCLSFIALSKYVVVFCHCWMSG